MTTFSDSFTRADSDNIATGSSISWDEADFSNYAETEWEIVSNSLRLVANYWATAIAGDSGAADHYAQCTVSNLVSSTDIYGPVVRGNSGNTQGYTAVAFTDRVRLYYGAGSSSPTTIGDTGTLTLTGTHVIRLEAEGNTLRVYVDGNLELTQDITGLGAVYTTGQYVGIAGNGSVGTAARVTAFSAGPLATEHTGSGSFAVAVTATASGAEEKTGSGSFAVAVTATAAGVVASAGAGSFAVTVTATAAGDIGKSGTGSAAISVSLTASGTKIATGVSAYSNLDLIHYPVDDDDSMPEWGQQVNTNIAALWALVAQPWKGWRADPSNIITAGAMESEGYYHQVGTTVVGQFAWKLAADTTTDTGGITLNLPIEAQDGPAVIGTWVLDDASGSAYGGLVVLNSGSSVVASLYAETGPALTKTTPIAMATGDTISVHVLYEALTFVPADPSAITFTQPLTNRTVAPGSNTTFTWAVDAPSGGTLNYKVERYAGPGLGTGGTDWTLLANQATTSYTFTNLQLADNGLTVRVTASNGLDTDRSSSAVVTVTVSGSTIEFVTPPNDVTVAAGGDATISWACTSPSGDPITYTIETDDPAGVGTGGTGWWYFGQQFGTSYTFYDVGLADTGTVVRITASNGTDGDAVAFATITVGTGGPGGGGGLTISDVYFMGHSLMKEGFTNPFSIDNNPVPALPDVHTPSYIATACTAAGFTANGVYGESGANVVTDGVANLTAAVAQWSDCDTIVLDFIINGDESAGAFLTAARACNAYILSQVPGMNIVWVEGHSHPTLSTGATVVDRWQNKNPMLQEMLDGDEIAGIVRWEAYAAANLDVYYTDGVHHWDDQAPYADFIVSTLTSLATPTDPGPGTTGLANRTMGFDNYSDTHFGNPLALTGPGNVHIKTNQLAMPFRAVETGTITHLSFNIKMNNANGYSGGDLGNLRAHIFAALASGEPTGSSLAQFTLTDPTSPNGDSTNGNVGKWALDSTLAVTAGNNYAIVVENIDPSPSSNFFSINLMVEYPTDGDNDPPPDLYFQNQATGDGYFTPWIKGSSYWNPSGGTGWNNYNGRTDPAGFMAWHNSCFEVYYQSGTRQGQGYVGARYGDSDYERDLTSSVGFRVNALSKRSGRTARYMCYRSGVSRQQWPVGMVVNGTLRSSGGTILATCSMTKAGAYWGRGQLSVPVVLADETTYLLEIFAASGSFPMRAMQTSLNGHGWEGDGQANLPGTGLYVSTNGGSTWSQPGGGAAYSLSLYLETTI